MAEENKASTFLFDLMVGGVSDTFSKTISAPWETVKLRLQLQGLGGAGRQPYTGMVDCCPHNTR